MSYKKLLELDPMRREEALIEYLKTHKPDCNELEAMFEDGVFDGEVVSEKGILIAYNDLLRGGDRAESIKSAGLEEEILKKMPVRRELMTIALLYPKIWECEGLLERFGDRLGYRNREEFISAIEEVIGG